MAARRTSWRKWMSTLTPSTLGLFAPSRSAGCSCADPRTARLKPSIHVRGFVRASSPFVAGSSRRASPLRWSSSQVCSVTSCPSKGQGFVVSPHPHSREDPGALFTRAPDLRVVLPQTRIPERNDSLGVLVAPLEQCNTSVHDDWRASRPARLDLSRCARNVDNEHLPLEPMPHLRHLAGAAGLDAAIHRSHL